MARAIKQTLNEFVPTMPGMDGQTTHGLPMNENPSLLIVDDDAAIVRLVEHIVSRHLSGLFQVVTFNDPQGGS